MTEQDAYIRAGGKLPTQAQHDALQQRNQQWIRGWGATTTDHGKRAVARLQAELELSRSNHETYGTEENPTAHTLGLRKVA